MASIQFFGYSRDIENYYNFYESLDIDYQGRFEFLFVKLSIFIRWVLNDFSFYIFSLVMLGLSVKFYILRNFDHFYKSLVLYLLIIFPVLELTQYRASIAIGLGYLSLYFLSIGRSVVTALIVFIISVFFHYSVVALLPFVFFWKMLSRNKLVEDLAFLLLITATLIVAKTSIYVFFSEINNTLLLNNEERPNFISSRNIVFSSILMFGFLKWKDIPYNIKPFFYISCYGFILSWLFFDLPVFSHRLFELTFMSYFIWVSFLYGWFLKISYLLLILLSVYLTYKYFYADPLFS